MNSGALVDENCMSFEDIDPNLTTASGISPIELPGRIMSETNFRGTWCAGHQHGQSHGVSAYLRHKDEVAPTSPFTIIVCFSARILCFILTPFTTFQLLS